MWRPGEGIVYWCMFLMFQDPKHHHSQHVFNVMNCDYEHPDVLTFENIILIHCQLLNLWKENAQLTCHEKAAICTKRIWTLEKEADGLRAHISSVLCAPWGWEMEGDRSVFIQSPSLKMWPWSSLAQIKMSALCAQLYSHIFRPLLTWFNPNLKGFCG